MQKDIKVELKVESLCLLTKNSIIVVAACVTAQPAKTGTQLLVYEVVQFNEE